MLYKKQRKRIADGGLGKMNSTKSIRRVLEKRQPMVIKDNKMKVVGWYILVNIGIVSWLSLISRGELLRIMPVLLPLSFAVPCIEFFMSRYLCKVAYDVRLVSEDNFEIPKEKKIYEIVQILSKNASLPETPEVGIYEDDDMNAFTTGFSKKKAIIAFSSRMVNHMKEEEIAAVAAHEIAHIANGDMLISTLVQSTLNVFIYLITVPLLILHIIAFFSDELDEVCFLIIWWIRDFVRMILLFLGDLIGNIFSRQREFEADRLAAALVSPDSMIAALKTFQQADIRLTRISRKYASLKINGRKRVLDVFSTHPSLERRIERLMKHKIAEIY